jgi:hypothetical protein
VIKKEIKIAGTEIPAGTKCYCVKTHVPSYCHVFPYTLPDDRILYLCPTTYHATITLMKMYREVGGRPEQNSLLQFAVVPQRLVRLHWRMEQEGVESEQILKAERLTRLLEGLDG